MAVLGICSLKGGVGKTSVTLGLASAAIYAGLRTLVVDLDPQADTTLALGVTGAAAADVAAVLDNPSSLVVQSAIAPSPWNPELLHAIVGSNESARHDGPSYAHRLTRLKHALEPLQSQYDLILIDCPPSLGGLTRQGLTSCDRALVVTELGLFSVTAAARAFQAIDQIKRESAPHLQPLGVLVNRVRARSSEQAYRQEELEKMFGPLILTTYIPERSALQQAQGAGSPIHAWPSRAARDLADRFDAVLNRALRSIARSKQAQSTAEAAVADVQADDQLKSTIDVHDTDVAHNTAEQPDGFEHAGVSELNGTAHTGSAIGVFEDHGGDEPELLRDSSELDNFDSAAHSAHHLSSLEQPETTMQPASYESFAPPSHRV